MDDREKGVRLAREMIPTTAADVEKGLPEGAFGSELPDLALNNVFGRLWARAGLDRRARSLLTLGILIALGSTDRRAGLLTAWARTRCASPGPALSPGGGRPG